MTYPYPVPGRVRFIMAMEWLFRYWLQAFLVLFGLVNLLPVLAPLAMATNLHPVGNAIYDLYGTISHQYANRSYFLFGGDLMYEPEALPLALDGAFNQDASLLKQFRGNPEIGWKLAWSDRLVSMFGAMWITALFYAMLRGRTTFRLPVWAAVLLITPLLADGATHWISDGISVTSGFRYDNQWLADLTGAAFAPEFYVGDAVGSFNHLARLFSGILLGIGFMGYALPGVEQYFARRAAILAEKLARWHQRQQTAAASSSLDSRP